MLVLRVTSSDLRFEHEWKTIVPGSSRRDIEIVHNLAPLHGVAEPIHKPVENCHARNIVGFKAVTQPFRLPLSSRTLESDDNVVNFRKWREMEGN